MAVQKKKPKLKKIKKCRNIQVFNWTTQKKAAALMLSTGGNTIEDTAKKLNISERAIYNWKEYPAFIQEIENHVLKNENFTRAGLLKNCLKGLKIKEHYIADDKNTYLDYIKQIAELQDLTKQHIDHNVKGSIDVTVRTPEEVEQAIIDKLDRIRSKRDGE